MPSATRIAGALARSLARDKVIEDDLALRERLELAVCKECCWPAQHALETYVSFPCVMPSSSEYQVASHVFRKSTLTSESFRPMRDSPHVNVQECLDSRV